MKNILLKTSFSKIYIIAMILISLLVVGGYFSYAMFTVSKERSNAISIVTGNLIYDLTVDGEDKESLVVPEGETKVFTVTLSNPNNRIARFNFYYLGTLPDDVTTGYSLLDGGMVTPVEAGVNLEKSGTSGSSNTYRIVVVNDSENEVIINLGVSVGLDYNDLSLPSNGYLFEPVTKGPVADVVITNPGENGSTYDDEVDTFLTGEEPDNYIWYSGKLWRAVSVNNEAKTTKLVTQWGISSVVYNSSNQTTFEGSYMKDWLNDTSVDGFLYNLRDYENFIVIDTKWNATMDDTNVGNLTRPSDSGTIVESTVGLLNMYEYQETFKGTTYSSGYLNNDLQWWLITPATSSDVWQVTSGSSTSDNPSDSGKPRHWPTYGNASIRPSIVLRSDVKIVAGNGTEEEPYRLLGDNDNDLNGVKLNTRYSGEYIRFGMGENNLYRIVSHENGVGTKITSAIPLRKSGNYILRTLDSNYLYYSSNTTLGTFLNGEYLTDYVGSGYDDMIEENSTWYMGTVLPGEHYRLAKYNNIDMDEYATSTKSKIGLLRDGELMTGQFDYSNYNQGYYLLTISRPPNTTNPLSVRFLSVSGTLGYVYNITDTFGIKPALNLKEDVIITGGDGTLNSPFKVELQ